MDCRNLDSRLGGNDKTASRDTSEPLFWGEWRSSLTIATIAQISCKGNMFLALRFFAKHRRSRGGRFGGRFAASLELRLLLELHTARQGAVDHEVRSGRETRGGAGEKHDAAADLLRFRHPPGWVQRQRVLEKVGQIVFDVLPGAAFEISIARRNRIDPDHFRRVLIGESLGVMNERGLHRAISRTGKIDLSARDRGNDDDRWMF